MAVSYKKLWVRLAENEMSAADLREKSNIEPNTLTRMRKDQDVMF